MPSKSRKQARTMRAIAHGWRPKNKGLKAIPKKVAKHFVAADKRKRR